MQLEVWAPFCSKEHSSLRPLYYPAVDCFVLVFSVAQPSMLEAAQHVWHRELTEFRERNPHKQVPVLLVGNHAELRDTGRDRPHSSASSAGGGSGSGGGGGGPPLCSADEAVEAARSCGMRQYIEIQSDNPAHVHEVFRQVRRRRRRRRRRFRFSFRRVHRFRHAAAAASAALLPCMCPLSGCGAA